MTFIQFKINYLAHSRFVNNPKRFWNLTNGTIKFDSKFGLNSIYKYILSSVYMLHLIIKKSGLTVKDCRIASIMWKVGAYTKTLLLTVN